MEVGEDWEGDRRHKQKKKEERNDHKTAFLKFPRQHLSVQAASLLHFQHSWFVSSGSQTF